MSTSKVPNEALLLLKKGQDCFFAASPDFAAAEKCYREAIVLAPIWGEAFHWLRSALENQGKIVEACDAARMAIDLLPNDPRPVIALGWLLQLSGKHTEAIAFLEKGLDLKPHYAEADARCMLAEAYEGAGENEKAISIWKEVLKMQPTYPSHERPMQEARERLKAREITEQSGSCWLP